MAVGILGFLIAGIQGAHGSGLGQYGRLRDLRFVAIERALHGIFRSYGQSLRVILILNEVGLIIGLLRTVVESGAAGGGMRHDRIQRFSQLFMIGGELYL